MKYLRFGTFWRESIRFKARQLNGTKRFVSFRSELSLAAWIAMCCFSATLLTPCVAQSVVATPPVVSLKIQINGGTISQPSLSAFSVPLFVLDRPTSGAWAGIVVAVTQAEIELAAGAWLPDSLAPATQPWFALIGNGAAAGRLFEITGNDSRRLRIRGLSPLSIGVVPGNRVELVRGYTLKSLFEGSEVKPGVTPNSADTIFLPEGGAWVGYYLSSSPREWRRANGGTSVSRDNLIIPPRTPVLVSRRDIAMRLQFGGRVPSVAQWATVEPSLTSTVALGFPAPITLNQLAIQSRLPDWRSNSNDQVFVLQAGQWTPFRYDGSRWLDASGAERGGLVLPSGSVLQILRTGLNSASREASLEPPYRL